MAFCIKRKESVSQSVRRLGCERLEHALDCLKESDRAAAVHGARKDIKKVRAVLRLVRRQIGGKEFHRETQVLHEAATQLAASRDAVVKVQTLRKLTQHARGQIAPGALRHTRTELRKICDEEAKHFAAEKAVRSVERILRRSLKSLARLKMSGNGWKVIGPGVKRAYRQGRDAYRAAVQDPSPENFHVWRKRAKDLWYQTRLLRPVWPEQLDATASELEALGVALGDDHDLTVLRQDVDRRRRNHGDPRELDVLDALIDERQRKLRTGALTLGARFYAEKPSVFCDRLADYWKTWRREKKTVVPSAEAPV